MSRSQKAEPPDELLLEASRFRVFRVYEHAPGSAPRPREIIRHPGSVVILPVWPDGRVCLIQNYRVAVGETLVELPAGTLENGEMPQQTAQRELQEETGLRAGTMRELLSFFAAPGILNENMHLFLATDLTEGDADREPGEQIQNLVVPFAEALEMTRRNQVRDAKTLVGLMYYATFLQPD